MVVTEEVVANDLEEARHLAELKAQDRDLNNESECYGVDSCLVEETDISSTPTSSGSSRMRKARR